MAESGVTEAGLKATLAEKIQAVHVDIEDMSGMLPHQPLAPSLPPLNPSLLPFSRLPFNVKSSVYN
jgi:hypothetical protein